MRNIIFLIFILSFFNNLFASELHFTKEQLKTKWKERILFFLDKKKLPKIDIQASITTSQIEKYFPKVLKTYDKLGIALSSYDGYQRPKDNSKGYRWSNYILDLTNTYPEYIIPTANGGTNKSWTQQNESFISQLEKEIQTGKYLNMGELEFRHYMSSKQCENKKHGRDIEIDLNSPNSRRVFALSEKSGVPFVIHLEAEDEHLDKVDKILTEFPKAKVVWAHFGQLRQPELQKNFKPETIKKLLSKHPNLYFDLAAGEPNRKYKCSGKNNNKILIGDTIFWVGKPGNQKNKIKKEWKKILVEFSDRFVFATDYGGGRKPLRDHLIKKVNVFNDVIKDLPEEAKHNIAYKNAWYLITGTKWQQ